MDKINTNKGLNEDMTIDGIVLDVNKIQERKRPRRSSGSGGSDVSGVSTKDDETAKMEKKEKIAPIIIFKLSEEMKDKAKIEEYLKDNIKDVIIEDYKLTANGNLLIYTKSNNDNEKILNNNKIFSGLNKLNLNVIDKKPYLVIKDMSIEYAEDKFDELNDKFGIIEIFEMKSKFTNKSHKMVKIELETDEIKRNLLAKRFIKMGIRKYYLEDFCKQPTQCRKCKGFGHVEIKCVSILKCGKCGQNHENEGCLKTKDELKCANCNGKHSTFYRGCPEYISAKNKISNDKGNVNTVIGSSEVLSNEYTRTYSNVTSNEELCNKFENMFQDMKKCINENTEKVIKQEMIPIQKSIDHIMVNMKMNNMKMCFFVIDVIKQLVPSVVVSDEKLKFIHDCYSFHELGKIEMNSLTAYYSKKNGPNGQNGNNGTNVVSKEHLYSPHPI
jgi:hypothetical protein